MFLAEIQQEICSYLDDDIIKKLCLLGLVTELASFASSNVWWHCRVETLSRCKLTYDDEPNWKGVYQAVKTDVRTTQGRLLWNVEDNLTALQVFKRMGFNPIPIDMARCCANGSVKIMKYLLTIQSIDPNNLPYGSGSDSGIHISILHRKSEILRLLLADPRTDVSRYGHFPTDHIETLKVILEDGRISPSQQRMNYHTKPKIVELLLKDGRIDPTWNNNEILLKTINNQNIELLKVLLQDRRVTESINRSTILAAERTKNRELLELILAKIDR